MKTKNNMAFGLFKKKSGEEQGPEFIEVDLEVEKAQSKVLVKTFSLKTYDDITPILTALREGDSIALIDIKTLKTKDVIELKRSISKIKKTVEAMEGTIAGFGDNMIIATPSFARVQKGVEEMQPAPSRRDSEYIERF
jgi:SepF-like predicted cell division protein (DUF552 family)